jgi:hypothetical protein
MPTSARPLPATENSITGRLPPRRQTSTRSFRAERGSATSSFHFSASLWTCHTISPDGKFGTGGSGFSFDSRVTGLSFDLIGRLPLMVSNNFPNGQLQPYLTIGPGVYFSHIEISPSPGFGSRDSDSSAGIKVAAGSTWMFTRNIGLFGEYRFSHFTADLLGFEKDVNTYRLQVGATFRF